MPIVQLGLTHINSHQLGCHHIPFNSALDKISSNLDPDPSRQVSNLPNQPDPLMITFKKGTDKSKKCAKLEHPSLNPLHLNSLPLLGHEKEVLACAWNPMRMQLASCSADGSARLWSLETYQPSSILLNHHIQPQLQPQSQSQLQSNLLSPLKKTACYHHLPVLVYREFKPDSSSKTHRTWIPVHSTVTTLGWHPEGKSLATATFDGTIRLWDVSQFEPRLLWLHWIHQGAIYILSWNPSGQFLLSAGADGRVILTIMNQMSLTLISSQNEGKMDLDPNLTSSPNSNPFQHIGVEPPLSIYSTLGHTDGILDARWSPSDHLLFATCSVDTRILIWKINPDQTGIKLDATSTNLDATITNLDQNPINPKKCETKSDPQWTPVAIGLNHQSAVNSMDWHPNDLILVSGGDDSIIYIWTIDLDLLTSDKSNITKHSHLIQDQQLIEPILSLTQSSPVQMVRFHTDSISREIKQRFHLISGSQDGLINIWQLKPIESSELVASKKTTLSCQLLFTLNHHIGPIHVLAFSPNRNRLATGSQDRNVAIWSIQEGNLLNQYKCPGSIMDLSWSSFQGEERVAAACSDNSLIVIHPN